VDGAVCSSRGGSRDGLRRQNMSSRVPVHVPILGTSDFSLPAQTERAVTVGGGAQKKNRRRLPVVCVRFPKSFQFLAHQPKNSDWRCLLTLVGTAVLSSGA